MCAMMHFVRTLAGREEMQVLNKEKQSLQQELDRLKSEMADCTASHSTALAEWVRAHTSF